jgi:uncharacterized damage-inducible protein DinB
MFTRVSDFEKAWAGESASTLKLLGTLSDASLAQAVGPGGRTAGRIAWHLATSIGEMMGRTGLSIDGPREQSAVPSTASDILRSYERAARSLAEQVKAHWTDKTLAVEDDMYGERWKRGITLSALVLHQSHHRGQLTVLMRQAGLKVAGVYGPAREEWSSYGMSPPEV